MMDLILSDGLLPHDWLFAKKLGPASPVKIHQILPPLIIHNHASLLSSPHLVDISSIYLIKHNSLI
jgi:hypothetical protein